MTRPWLALALLAAFGGGCSSCSCNSNRAVPFKRGSSQTVERGDGGAALATSQKRPGSTYPAGTREVQLAGQRIQLSTGAIRAALDVDLDGDGRSDALLLSEDDAGAPSLQSSLRGEQDLQPPSLVAAFASADEHCALASAELEALDTSYALAKVELLCGAPPAVPAAPPAPAPGPAPGGPTPPDPPAPAGTLPSPTAPAGTAPGAVLPGLAPHGRRLLWVIALENPPRVLERISMPASDDPTPPKLDASLAAGDFDADGHSDLQLALDVAAPELATTHVELTLWNRAGGLARDRAEPEQTLLALAEQAKTERKRKPANAALLARQVLSAYGALCREAGSARLGSDGGQGLECGASLAAGRAGSVLAAVLATEGKLLEAALRYQALSSPALRMTDNDWERVKSALAARIDRSFSWREGPSVPMPPGSAARASLIAFLDERHVLLRGTSPRSYDLQAGTAEPIGVHGSTVIMDPGARFALAAVVHDCSGDKLSVVRVAQLVEGVVAGPPVAQPLIEAAPVGVPCAATHDERSAFRPLSWTREGVLLARGAELWLVALDDAAQAAVAAKRIEPGTALPPETYSGEVSADGRLHALLTPLGIAVLERASGNVRLVALPDPPGGTSTDVALSPSGKAIAIVRDGKLFVAVAGENGAPAPAPAPVPAPAPAAAPAPAPAPELTPAPAPAHPTAPAPAAPAAAPQPASPPPAVAPPTSGVLHEPPPSP